MTGYASAYFRQLIKRGRLHTQKRGRDWFLDRAEVLAYAEEMEQLRPKKYDPWRTAAKSKNDGNNHHFTGCYDSVPNRTTGAADSKKTR